MNNTRSFEPNPKTQKFTNVFFSTTRVHHDLGPMLFQEFHQVILILVRTLDTIVYITRIVYVKKIKLSIMHFFLNMYISFLACTFHIL